MVAVKKVMSAEKKKQDALDRRAGQKEKFQDYLHMKREKQEWKSMQEKLLKEMTGRLRRWRYRGTWAARKELYDLL